jgi:hypothetical protein
MRLPARPDYSRREGLPSLLGPQQDLARPRSVAVGAAPGTEWLPRSGYPEIRWMGAICCRTIRGWSYLPRPARSTTVSDSKTDKSR